MLNNWWPAELGVPSSTGGQNDSRYAFFPTVRRLAVLTGGELRVFDTHEHNIGGVSQQQGSGPQGLQFSSQLGTFTVASLPEVTQAPRAGRISGSSSRPKVSARTRRASAPTSDVNSSSDILASIEALAGLHQRGILSDEEFATKKAELLARL